MAVGSGLSSSFGYSKETVYGTRVAPAKFVPHRKFDVNGIYQRVTGEGIVSGALSPRGDQLAEVSTAATASAEFDVQTLNMVRLIENLMGTTAVSAQQGGTAAYLHTFTLGDNLGKMLTMQSNAPLRDGTTKAKEITGAKCTSATFSVGVNELLTAQMEFDGQGYSTAQTLASPSYVASKVFNFKQAAFKLGTFNSEVAISGVRAFSCTIDRPQDVDAYQFGAAGVKQQPVLNGLTSITGSIEFDYINTADFETRMSAMTLDSLVFECVTTTAIATTYFPTFRITLPGVHFEGMVNAEGTDVVRPTFSFTHLYDGTNMPFIQIMSSETSV